MRFWPRHRSIETEAADRTESPPADLVDRKLDDEQNRETTPPSEEAVELHCMCLAEGYLPAHVPQLLEGMKQVGWDVDPTAGDSPLKWVERSRESGGAGARAPVGVLVRESRGAFGRSWSMDLPGGVDHAHATFWAISSGLTVLTVQFVFTDEQALFMDRILRTTFDSYVTPVDRGWQIHDPPNQKREALLEARRELRRRCGDWLAARLPGAFAGGLLAGDWPAVEVITAERFEPFRDEMGPGMWDYREILRLTGSFDVLASAQVENLRLRLPSPFDEPGNVISAAGEKGKLFSDENLGDYGGGNSRWGFANWLHHRLDDVAAGWACVHLVRGYQAALSARRDRLVDEAREVEAEATLASIGQLRRDLLPRARDAQVLGAELEALCEEEFSMPFRGLDWAYESDHPDKRRLGTRWRNECQYIARVLGRTETRLREALATDAQLSVAAANLALQHRVTVLTRVSLGLAAVAAVAAIVAVL